MQTSICFYKGWEMIREQKKASLALRALPPIEGEEMTLTRGCHAERSEVSD